MDMVSLIERSESVELDGGDDDDDEMRFEGPLEQELPDQDQDQDQDQDLEQDAANEPLEGLLANRRELRRRARTMPPPAGASPEFGDPELEHEPDEEQLKRILGCKRLSEGNCAAINYQRHHLANICRKNSLHMIGESLPPVTEGEPMRHMSHLLSQSIEAGAGSASSSSLRGGGGGVGVAGRQLANGGKRNSQDENAAASCSSSTSLDGTSSSRSPSRRRSSTVSQCSSVLSEGTRQQLNFDLSPDLAPDSSILEANAISPTEFERPASPEPSSLDSMGDFEPHSTGSFDMLRPVSRISDCAQFNLSSTSEAEQSETTPMTVSELERADSPELQKAHHLLETQHQHRHHHDHHHHHQHHRAESLERIITNVSEVKVSSNQSGEARVDDSAGQQQMPGAMADGVERHLTAGQKRAHTPFGPNCQRSKATHIEQAGD